MCSSDLGGQNSHEILLQMPGIQDPEHVKKLLAGESHLELVHVISPPSPQPAQTYASEAEATASLNSGVKIPANRRVLPYSERPELAGQDANANAPVQKKWVVVESPAIIDGSEGQGQGISRSGGRRRQDRLPSVDLG